jgi:hypothetical protein
MIMKAVKLISLLLVLLFIISCGSQETKPIQRIKAKFRETPPPNIPIDKGFSEYISGFTSGIIPANSAIEIRFTPEFAGKADKSATGLFTFDPAVKGKTEWKDATTLVFTPSRVLDPGKTYTASLNLGKLASVTERLNVFQLRIQTLRKDFRITIGALECTSSESNIYLLRGQIVTSDFIEQGEVENFATAKMGRKKLEIEWDHSVNLIHTFTILNGQTKSRNSFSPGMVILPE